MAFTAPEDELLQDEGFSAPEDEILEFNTGEGPVESAFNAAGRGLGQVFTGTAEGLGQFSQSYVRNLNPVGIAAQMGVPGAQSLVDTFSQPGKYVEELGAAGTEAVSEALPVNPLYEESVGTRAAETVGQAGGQLLSMLGPAAVTKAPKLIQALGLGQAGLLELKSGYDEADRLGITEPWERDTLAGIYAAAGVGVEGIGGVGSKGFAQALTGEVMDVLQGSAIKRAAKTMATEGLVEEPLTGFAQAAGSNLMAEEDPLNPGFTVNGQALPSINPATGEFWADRTEEAAYGTLGGGVFAGVQFAMTRPKLEQAKRLHQKAQIAETLLEDKPNPTPQDVADLQEIRESRTQLGEFISEGEKKLAVPPDAPMETPKDEATAVLAQNVDVPDVSASTDALAQIISDTPDETPVVTEPPVTELVTEEPFIAPEDELVEEPVLASQMPAVELLADSGPSVTPSVEPLLGTALAPVTEPSSIAPPVTAPSQSALTNEAATEDAWLASPEFTQAEELAASGNIEAAEAVEASFREKQAQTPPSPENAPQATETPVETRQIKNSRPVELNVITKAGLGKKTVEATPEAKKSLISQKKLYTQLLKCLNS